MIRTRKLLNRLTKYFILSTALPILAIIILSAGLLERYYTRQLLTLMDGYVDSTAENISMYIGNLEQVILLPYFDDEVMSLLSKYSKQDDVSFVEQTIFENAFGNLISSIRYVSNNFYSTLIVHDDDVIYSSSNYTLSEPLNDHSWSEEDWYQKAIEENGNIIFVPPHRTDYYSPSDDEIKISLVCTIRNLVTRTPYAVIKIDILPSSFASFFANLDFDVPFSAYISDTENNLVFSTSSDSFMEKMLPLKEENGQIKIEEYNENLVHHIQHNIVDTPYTLNILLDKTTMMKRTVTVYAIGIGLYIIAFIIALLLNRRLTKRISEPITAMRKVLSEVEKGNFNVSYESRKGWELEELGTSLNHAIDDLKDLIEKNYIAKLAEEKAENKALLSQLQPHFLFNTLNTLIALIYEEKYKELENGLYSLSDLLRYVLRKDNLVPLSDEMNFIMSYLLLQKDRFGDRLDYSVSVDEKVQKILVPRLLVQPFVENAVIHGMEPDKRKCTIQITAEEKDGRMMITITDDGRGFDMDRTDIMSSIGISNSFDRVKILDPEATVNISSSPGNGCIVIIGIKEVSSYENPDC